MNKTYRAELRALDAAERRLERDQHRAGQVCARQDARRNRSPQKGRRARELELIQRRRAILRGRLGY